jgi:hypothetical protein
MTTQQQADAYRFFAIAFGAAPGVTYMNQIAQAYAAGMTTKQIVNIYTTKDQFTSVYPDFYTNAQFANALIENVVGSSASDAAKTQAKADVEASLAAGWSRGDVIYQIFTNLANKPLTDPDWGNTAKLLANQVAVAQYYTEVKLGDTTDLAVLKSVIARVTPTTDVSTPDALDAVLAGAVAGQTFTLTTGLDNITGSSGNDTINGTHSTLTLGDVIDGGAGSADTLYIGDTGSGGGVNFSLATIKNVEKLLYQAANNTSNTLNLAGLSGLQSVTYQDLNSTHRNVTINTKGNATSVTVKNAATVAVSDAATTDTLASVSIDGNSGASAIINSDALTSLSLANTNVATIVGAAPGARTLNVTVNNVTGGATIVDNTATAVAITGSGKASTIGLNASAATSLSFAGDAAVTLTAAPVSVTGITSTNTAGVTITGPLSNGVSFTGGDGNDEVTVGATTKTIDMGKGDDTVHVTSALGVGGALVGGDGTDTLAMTASLAQTLSATSTFGKAVSGFEHLDIGQVTSGGNVTVNMANMAGINYVVSAGTAAGTGTPEVQTVTFSPADPDGGVLTVGGVDVTIPSGATAAQVTNAVYSKAAAILAANPNLGDISLDGGQLVLTYKNTAGDVPNISVAQNGSGVTFGGVNTTTAGVNEVSEQQTIKITAAPAATGLVQISVLGTPVQFTATSGQTVDQVAAAMQAAINDAGISGVNNATFVNGTGTVTITYAGSVGDAPAATFTDTGVTGVHATVTDNAVPYVAPVAEVQEVQITHGTDADGGEIVVDGARIALAGNLSIDQVGVAITGQLLAIQAADPHVAGLAYNTATDKLTITYTAAAGDVVNATLKDNDTTGVGSIVTETTQGVAGAAAGQLALNNLASGATLELTNNSDGPVTVALKDTSGSADVVNVVLDGTNSLWVGGGLNIAGVETINITTTDSDPANDPMFASYLVLNAPDATKIVVSGNHGLYVDAASNLSKVVNFDASGVNSTLTTGAGTAAAVVFASQVTNQNVTVTTGNGDDWISVASIIDSTKGGTVTTGAGNDTVNGSSGSDTINLGDGNDWVYSSGKADTITLGAGKDTYVLANVTDSTIAARDVITDFQANTVGQGAGGTVNSQGAATSLSARNGDVIDLSSVDAGLNGIRVGVFSNAANAQTFVQNGATDTHTWVNAALDSTTGFLYLDVTDDGVVDSVIQLTGVTTINEAAFVI